MTTRAQQWDGEAATFDDEVDHGLLGAARSSWSDLVTSWLPHSPCDVADLGCGTGSLSVLLASHGHRVTGVDFSTQMLRRARAKAREHAVPVAFELGDAGDPRLPSAAFDVVLTRHVLWDLPDQEGALARWAELLRPGGRFVLVEGSWSTGAGLTSTAVVELVRPHVEECRVQRLDDPALWGGPIGDERFAVLASVGRSGAAGGNGRALPGPEVEHPG